MPEYQYPFISGIDQIIMPSENLHPFISNHHIITSSNHYIIISLYHHSSNDVLDETNNETDKFNDYNETIVVNSIMIN
jgi:hypothetical protein